MKIEGGCYCGEIRYRVEGDPLLKVQCHCRECQFISGGAPNVTMGMPEAGFAYTKGSAKPFRRSDLQAPVTRAIRPKCFSPGAEQGATEKVAPRGRCGRIWLA